jgi:E3 ubiquitin-protein ligase HERC4
MLTDIRKATNAYCDEDFESAMDQTFVFAARNPDGTEGEEIELCAGGKQRRLTRSNSEEFIALTVKVILNRALPQMAKVREGIELICGKELPYVLSWRYCEERVVGKTETDVEYLKRFTNYEDHFTQSDSKCKKWFWEIMHEMTEEDRQLYLRFVNG